MAGGGGKGKGGDRKGKGKGEKGKKGGRGDVRPLPNSHRCCRLLRG